MKEALNFARRGWFVFPVGQDKRPLIKEWPDKATMDEDQIRRWAKKFKGCNWAVNCGRSGLIVVDVDSAKVPEAGPAYEALEFDYGLEPALTVRTPSGGWHHYFAGVSKSGNARLGRGIDIKSHGGYVLLPGSSIGGKEYTVVKEGTPANAPEAFTALLEKPTEKAVEHKEAETTDSPLDLAAFSAELVEHEDPQEGTRNQATFQMAARAHDLGLTISTALYLMRQLWLPKLGDFSQEELDRTVKSAFSSVQGEHGGASAANAFDEPWDEKDMPGYVERKADVDDGPLHFSSFLTDPPDRDWLIEDWLPLGEVTSLYGDGGIGKSLLAQQLGMAVATGGKFMDLTVARGLPVLGVFCEDTLEELHRRTYSISQATEGAFAEDSPFFLWSRAQKDNALAKIDAGEIKKVYPFYKRLQAELGKIEGPKLLILDTLADLFDGNEVDRGSANKFIKVVLGRLVRKHDCTILLLAHPSAGNIEVTKGGRAGISGSTAWNNAVRTRLVLRRHEKLDDCRVLSRVKSNYAKVGEEVFMTWHNGSFRKMDAVEEMAANEETTKNLIMEAVANQARTGTPFGTHGSSKVSIYNAGLIDGNGKPIPKDDLKKLIAVMVREGDLVVVTGMPRNNGLWPAGGPEHEGFQ